MDEIGAIIVRARGNGQGGLSNNYAKVFEPVCLALPMEEKRIIDKIVMHVLGLIALVSSVKPGSF